MAYHQPHGFIHIVLIIINMFIILLRRKVAHKGQERKENERKMRTMKVQLES